MNIPPKLLRSMALLYLYLLLPPPRKGTHKAWHPVISPSVCLSVRVCPKSAEYIGAGLNLVQTPMTNIICYAVAMLRAPPKTLDRLRIL